MKTYQGNGGIAPRIWY